MTRSDRQTTENQRFEILKFADEKRLHIDQWVEETISATKHLDDRQLGALFARLQADDVLIVTELSRFGRSIVEVMSILHRIMETDAKVFTTKERYELGNTISSKVLAFAFSLSAEIERSMISSRTKYVCRSSKPARKHAYPVRLPLVVIAAAFGVCVLAGGTMVRTAEGGIHGIDPSVDSHEHVAAG